MNLFNKTPFPLHPWLGAALFNLYAGEIEHLPESLDAGLKTHRSLWSFRASVSVMAFLLGAVFCVLLTGLLLIIRLCIVVKTGSKCQPRTKGSVAVLVVAGSGNVNN